MRQWQLGLAGALLTGFFLAALFPPLNIPFLAPAALAPLLFALAHTGGWRAAFGWGWVAGFVSWLAVCHWIREVLFNYGGLTGVLSWVAVILFAAIKAIHLGVFALLARQPVRRWWAIPAVAALWTGIERTHGPLGFAWLALGNAGIGMNLPLRLAPFTGVYGLSFVFAATACAVALVALRRGRRELLWLAPLAALALLPAIELKKAPEAEAVSAQMAIPMDYRWTPDEKDRAVRHLALMTLQSALDAAQRKPALLVWPEAPAPFYYYEDMEFRSTMNELARAAGAALLFGGVAHTADRAPLNSAVMLTAEGRLTGRYDKRYLVPFGEFIPPGFGWIEKISSEAGDYAAGREVRVFEFAGHTAGPFICYEAAFPQLVREVADAGAEVLVNLSNDGYFGRSAARPQHLLLARMRAVENRRWLIRSTNDGITASIDPAGRVWDRQPEFKRLAARLRFGWERDKTLYTRWGDWFAWSCLALGLALWACALAPQYRPVSRGE
jgi:apolipoprotein N-acyltransferase